MYLESGVGINYTVTVPVAGFIFGSLGGSCESPNRNNQGGLCFMETDGTEVWKEIYGGRYSVSNMGRIKRIACFQSYTMHHVGRVCTLAINRYGYQTKGFWVDGKAYPKSIHSIVMAAFAGPRPDGYEINHINGNKTDNRLVNLEYVTGSENKRHAVAFGLAYFGEKHGRSILTEDEVLQIRYLRNVGYESTDLSARFGVSKGTINKVASGRSWSHIR